MYRETQRIEMVQRSAASYAQNDYHYRSISSVTNMLRELKWSTHVQRRNQASLIMLHKIHNKQVNVKSITAILQLHKTTNSLFPTQKQNTT